MPLYEYECETHGQFELLRSMSEFDKVAHCPECNESVRRIVSAPNFSHMARSEVIARDRNEKSRHEPRLSSTPDGHVHTSRCNHGPATPKKREGQAPALQRYGGKRPWVMEH